MKLRREPRMPGDLPVGALLFACILFIPLGAYYVDSGAFTFSECGIKASFGIPCLSCGATRATLHLLHGDFVDAIQMQPLVISLYALIVVWGSASLWAMRRNRTYFPELSVKEGVSFVALCVVVVLGNWVYLLKAGI